MYFECLIFKIWSIPAAASVRPTGRSLAIA